MEYNFVTNYKIVLEFKKIPYYKTNLGYAATEEKASNRILSNKNKFAFDYNRRYSSTIMLCGNIGDISIYADHGVKNDVILIYVGDEEFIFPFKFDECNKIGIGAYLGSMLKKIEEKLSESNTNNVIDDTSIDTVDSSIKTKIGNPKNLIDNPGQVSWEDILAYKKMMNKQK
jgi:hypothetical protein